MDLAYNEKSKVGRNTILYFASMMIPKIVGLLMLPIYSKYINPSELGIYGFTTSLVAIIAVLSCMGLNVFYLRNYTRIENKKWLNGTIFWSMLIWNIILIALSLIVMPFIWKVFGFSITYWPYVPLALITQFFNSIEVIPMRTYRIRGEVNNYLIRIVVKSILTVIFGIFFLMGTHSGVLGRYYSDLLNAVIFSVVFIIYMVRRSDFNIDVKLLKYALKFGLPIVPSDLITAGITTVNTMIIVKFISLSQLGIYVMGLSISSIVNAISTSISFSVEPEFYIHADTKDFPVFAKKLKDFKIVSVSWICVGCSLFIREATIILLSEKYWETWSVVQVLSISYIFAALQGVLIQHAIIQNRTKLLTWSNLGNVIAIIIMGYLLFPIYGSLALGWTNCAGYLCSFIILYLFIDKENIKNNKFINDFIMIAISIAFLYVGRIFHNMQLIQCILLKGVLFLIYTMIILNIYKLNIIKLLLTKIKNISLK